MLNLEKQIESALGCGLPQARDARHLRDVEKVFELVRFVDEQPVDTEFLEGQRVVFRGTTRAPLTKELNGTPGTHRPLAIGIRCEGPLQNT